MLFICLVWLVMVEVEKTVTRDSTKYLSDFISLPVAMFSRETLTIITGIKASKCSLMIYLKWCVSR